MKKILIYSPRWFPSIGGMEMHVKTLVDSSKLNFEIITSAASGYPLEESVNDRTKLTRFMPFDKEVVSDSRSSLSKLSFPSRHKGDKKRLEDIQKYLDNAEYDILHNQYPNIPHTFAKLTIMKNKIIGHEFIDLKSKKPKLLTVHGLLSPQSDCQAIEDYEKKIISSYQNIICVDKKVEEFVRKLDPHKNIWNIPNSINTSKFSFKPKSANKEKLQVGFVGRLESSRGVELLEKLVESKPEYIDLHIIGSGNQIMVDKFIKKCTGANINFQKNIPNDELPSFLQSMDVLFNPVMVEGISRISLEAMSCGTPPIMLDKGDRKPVNHGETGYLVKPDIEPIKEQLINIQKSKEDLAKISKNARKAVEKEFSNDVIIPKIEAVYNKILEGK